MSAGTQNGRFIMAFNSQVSAAFLATRNENNYSLANANVDFALLRVEVPRQFEGLGNALSRHRRQNAESGPQHRIARRLGALFEQIIPNIDILTATYGERVSEIATSSQFDLKVCRTTAHQLPILCSNALFLTIVCSRTPTTVPFLGMWEWTALPSTQQHLPERVLSRFIFSLVC